MWPSILKASKEGGLNVIETYLFWFTYPQSNLSRVRNGHEPSQGHFNFEENYDVFTFIEEAQRQGLFVILRVGPYGRKACVLSDLRVCAEWNYGGFPVWLRDVPGMVFRTYNEPFMWQQSWF